MSTLMKNLQALAKWMPAAAARIEAAQIPPGFTQRTGSDGTPTFAHDVGNQTHWLGATSMPRASAQPLTKSLNPAASPTGLGLSIGTGFEWIAFTDRLGPAQSLYIYENDPSILRMALSICDLSPRLASGQILLITGTADDAGRELTDFLFTHVGFEPPTVLHPLPTLAGEKRNTLLTAGESIVRRALLDRQNFITKISAAWQQRKENAKPLAITRSSRYPLERPLETVTANNLRVDRFDCCSVALRLQTIVEQNPARILSDFFRIQLACVPPEIPVETWIPPSVGAGFWEAIPPADTLAPSDRIVIHFASHESILLEKGFTPHQLDVRPLTLPAKSTHPNTATRIALLAELPPIDPQSLGITLPTHVSVYTAAVEILREEFLTAHFAQFPDILRRAIYRAGAASHDTALRETLTKVIRLVLLPTVPLLTLAEELRRRDFKIKLIGDWPTKFSDDATAPFADPDKWSDVAAVLHLSPWGTFSPLLAEPLTLGIPILAPEHPTDRRAGSLAMIAGKDRLDDIPRQRLFAILKDRLQGR